MSYNKRYKENSICKCIACGKEFVKVNSLQRYCCRECQRKQNWKNQSAKVPPIPEVNRKCINCGNEFKTKLYNQVYCSSKCRKEASKKRNATEGKSRPLTRDSLYLIHKYVAEGMKPENVASMLNRNVESIYEALEKPITPYQKACMMMFFNPYIDRKVAKGWK